MKNTLNLNNEEKLFGTKTKQDWIDIRSKILSNPNDTKNWEDAFGLLDLRLNTRYLNPIEKTLHMNVLTGEGFAVMTLICSLIEFLQSCYEGIYYKYENSPPFEYSNKEAQNVFKRFLQNHEPFKTEFLKKSSDPENKGVKTIADDFYSNVRCGLLHEAATKNNWIINSDISNNTENIVDVSDPSYKKIYRENFVEAIKKFISNYKQNLLDNTKDSTGKSLRDNFCRKLDMLGNYKDNAHWWN